jgi:lipopolysaccharide export system permease protein
VVLLNGHGVQSDFDTGEFDWLSFDKYTLFLDDPRVDYSTDESRYKDTGELLQSDDPNDQSELFWRFGFPLMVITLGILAIPLAFVRPRSGKAMHGLVAFVLFMVYNNIAAYIAARIARGSLDTWSSFVMLHGGVIVLAIVLLLLGDYQSVLKGWRTRWFGFFWGKK